MAIIELFEGLRVSIAVDGVDVAEYNASSEIDINDESPLALYKRSATSYKYVEALSGKDFTINLHAEKPFTVECDVLRFEIVVDGKVISRLLLPKSHYKGGGGIWDAIATGPLTVVDGKLVTRAMTFETIETTSEDMFDRVLKEQANTLKDVGEIVVLVTCRNYKAAGDASVAPASVPAARVIATAGLNSAVGGGPSHHNGSAGSKYHEKLLVKKSMSHTTVLGPSTPMDKGNPKRRETVAIEGPEMFLAKFCFKYRSKDKLQSLLVIGRSPPPEPAQPEAEGDPEPANQAPTPPSKLIDAQKSLAKMKADLKKKQEEINRYMRECSILADDDAESDSTVKDEPDASSMGPAMQFANTPAAPRNKRQRAGYDDEPATANAHGTKKSKRKPKVPECIDLTQEDEEGIVIE